MNVLVWQHCKVRRHKWAVFMGRDLKGQCSERGLDTIYKSIRNGGCMHVFSSAKPSLFQDYLSSEQGVKHEPLNFWTELLNV
jgi:hypothetical protein